jgi:ethanolamine ammonia-lyase small subunit
MNETLRPVPAPAPEARSQTAPDLWARFRESTRARIGLGRSGDALPTEALLEFQLAHARARDAVHSKADFSRIAAELAPLETIEVESAAPDRITYLRRPDLGRRLSEESGAKLAKADWDICFVIADGLSAAAVDAHAAALVHATLPYLGGWSVGPVVLASQARVALGDDVAERLGARLVALLVGERPGLSAADSLGVYITWMPHVGRQDSERNCISNIHGAGLSIAAGADKLGWLLNEAARLRLTGVDLKENAPAITGPREAAQLAAHS